MAAEPSTTEPLSSVVIPPQNRHELLARASRSVLDQRRVTVECIVVDDGSDVPVESFEDPRVHVLRHERPLDVAVARNTGIKGATGTHVSFLDDDDLYLLTRLAVVAEHLIPGVAVVAGPKPSAESQRRAGCCSGTSPIGS